MKPRLYTARRDVPTFTKFSCPTVHLAQYAHLVIGNQVKAIPPTLPATGRGCQPRFRGSSGEAQEGYILVS